MKIQDSRRGGILFGLLLSALAVVCVIFAAGIHLVSHIRVESRDNTGGTHVSIDTPVGDLSVHAHDRRGAGAAGVPLYPGARSLKDRGGDAVVEWTSKNDGPDDGFALTASEMVTDDPVDQVADYYRKQLPNWVVVREKGGAARMELREGGYQRIVAIRAEHGGTHIGVASVGEPASN